MLLKLVVDLNDMLIYLSDYLTGYKLKLKSASRSGTERSEILNHGSTQHIKTMFNESFSLVACNRCYTAFCQFSNGIRA